MKPRTILGVLSCVLLLSLVGCTPGAPAKTLQRDGGARITLRAACLPDQANCDLNARLNSVMDALLRRASAAGYQDAIVRKGDGTQTVVVEAPGAADGRQL